MPVDYAVNQSNDNQRQPHTGGAAYGVEPYYYGATDNDDLYNQEQGQWQQYANEGVQPTGISQSIKDNETNSQNNVSNSQGDQLAALNLMKSYAMGAQTPAEKQAAATQSYNLNAQHAMAANAGGAQGVAAARSGAAQTSATAASMNANANRALGAQEQQNYANAYTNQANAMRGSEQSLYGINNDAAYSAAQNQESINQANDQLMLGYSGLQNSAIAGLRQVDLGQGQFNLQQSANNQAQANQIVGGTMGGIAGGAKAWSSGNNNGGSSGDGGNSGGGGGGSYGGGSAWNDDNPNDFSSDERKKGNVQHGGLMRSFLDTLADSRATYNYRDPADEPRVVPTGGRYAGVMAQDLERVPELGHQLVIDTPNGKYVDQKSMTSALSAGLGEIHDRVRRLEARLS